MIKKLLPIVFLFITFQTWAKPNIESHKKFSKRVLKTLTKQSLSRFRKCFADEEKLIYFSQRHFPESTKEENIEQGKRMAQQVDKEVPKLFLKLNNWANQKNVNWNKIKLKSSEIKCREKHHGELCDIRISIEHEGKPFKFILDDCILVNNKWYIADDIKFDS